MAGEPSARRPRLPAAGHRLQGHDAAARRRRRVPLRRRRHRRPRRRAHRRQGRRHRGPGLHLAPPPSPTGSGPASSRSASPASCPGRRSSETYELEYGTDALEIHEDAHRAGRRGVLVVDDVLATGGTAAATCRLVEHLGGVIAGLAFVVELGFLGGRAKLRRTARRARSDHRLNERRRQGCPRSTGSCRGGATTSRRRTRSRPC